MKVKKVCFLLNFVGRIARADFFFALLSLRQCHLRRHLALQDLIPPHRRRHRRHSDLLRDHHKGYTSYVRWQPRWWALTLAWDPLGEDRFSVQKTCFSERRTCAPPHFLSWCGPCCTWVGAPAARRPGTGSRDSWRPGARRRRRGAPLSAQPRGYTQNPVPWTKLKHKIERCTRMIFLFLSLKSNLWFITVLRIRDVYPGS